MCAVAAFVHPSVMSVPLGVAVHSVGSATATAVKYVARKSLGGYVMKCPNPSSAPVPPLLLTQSVALDAPFAW